MKLKILLSVVLVMISNSLPACYFCMRDDDEITDRLVHEGKLVRVIADRSPSVPGHLLITPKRHVAKVEDLTQEEWEEIHPTIAKVAALFPIAYGKEDALVMLRNGEGAGQKVFHVHFHCYPSDNPEILKALVPRPPRMDDLRLKHEANRLQLLWATRVDPHPYFKQREALEAKGEWARLLALGLEAIQTPHLPPLACGLIEADLASYSFYLGHYDQALNQATAALALAKSRDDSDLIIRASYLGSAALRGLSGKSPDPTFQALYRNRAQDLLTDAFDIAGPDTPPTLMGKLFYNSARLKMDYQLAAPAIDDLGWASFYFERAGSTEDMIRAQIAQVRLLLKEGRAEEAEPILATWLDAKCKPRTRVFMDEVRSLYHRANGDQLTARSLLKKAVSLAEALGMEEDVRRLS